MPIAFASQERANILIAIGVGICPLAILLVVFKVAYISISGRIRLCAPGFCALTSFHIIREIANIYAAVHIGISAIPVLPIIFKFADVLAAIRPGFFTLICLHVVREIPNIYDAIRIGIGTLTIKHVIFKGADVFVAG